MNQTIDLIRHLSQLDGVSGCEEAVADWIKAWLNKQDSGIVCSSDCRGNLICYKKGRKTPKNKLMFSAHMDEVGFIITYIEESGLLRFSNIGSIDTRVVVGKPVRLENGLRGVVGAKPIHLQSAQEQSEPLEMKKLSIDIGACTREEAQSKVSLGDRASFYSEFASLGTHKIKGKALDDRAGCAVLMSLLQRDLEFDLTVVFTTQEESGGFAAGSAAFAIAPQIAVIVDATCAADVPGVAPGEQLATQGEGPCLSFKDDRTLYDMSLYRLALKAGKKKEIPCQPIQGTVGHNESNSIQASGCGARVLAVSLPCRYLHSGASVLDKRDITATLDLLEVLVKQFGDLEDPSEANA